MTISLGSVGDLIAANSNRSASSASVDSASDVGTGVPKGAKGSASSTVLALDDSARVRKRRQLNEDKDVTA